MDDRKTPAESVLYWIAWIVGIIGMIVLFWYFIWGKRLA
jgi:Mg2+ and Co2+ transporter CorA